MSSRSSARGVPRTSGGVLLRVVSALAIATIGVPTAGDAQEDPARTTLDGVYTSEQAAEGKRIYTRACAGCHTLDWYQGDVVRAWEGGTLFGLFDIISTTMPQDNPGSLGRRDYLDVLAYILELNGLPAGEDPLPVGRSRLNAIRFKFDSAQPGEDACPHPTPAEAAPAAPSSPSRCSPPRR